MGKSCEIRLFKLIKSYSCTVSLRKNLMFDSKLFGVVRRWFVVLLHKAIFKVANVVDHFLCSV